MLLLLLGTEVFSISKYQIYASHHVGLYRTKYLFFSTSLGKLIVNLQREARNEFNGSTAWRTPHACDSHDISRLHKIYSSLNRKFYFHEDANISTSNWRVNSSIIALLNSLLICSLLIVLLLWIINRREILL